MLEKTVPPPLVGVKQDMYAKLVLLLMTSTLSSLDTSLGTMLR